MISRLSSVACAGPTPSERKPPARRRRAAPPGEADYAATSRVLRPRVGDGPHGLTVFFKFSFFCAVGPWVLLARLIIRGATHFSLHCALVRARTLSRAPANRRQIIATADMARGDADADVLRAGTAERRVYPRHERSDRCVKKNHTRATTAGWRPGDPRTKSIYYIEQRSAKRTRAATPDESSSRSRRSSSASARRVAFLPSRLRFATMNAAKRPSGMARIASE